MGDEIAQGSCVEAIYRDSNLLPSGWKAPNPTTEPPCTPQSIVLYLRLLHCRHTATATEKSKVLSLLNIFLQLSFKGLQLCFENLILVSQSHGETAYDVFKGTAMRNMQICRLRSLFGTRGLVAVSCWDTVRYFRL